MPRELLARKDARPLARDILQMTREEFGAACKGSAVKRAKLRGLTRDAAVLLGSVGTVEDVPVLEQALDDGEPLEREHAAWAPPRIGSCTRSTDVAQPSATAARSECTIDPRR